MHVTGDAGAQELVGAARPEHAEPLVDAVVAHLRALGAIVATGRFRTDMRVTLTNDGPVTVMLEVEGPERQESVALTSQRKIVLVGSRRSR